MKPARTTIQPQPPSGAMGTAPSSVSSASSSSLSTLSCLLRLKSEQTLSLVSEPTVIIRKGLLTLLSTSALILTHSMPKVFWQRFYLITYFSALRSNFTSLSPHYCCHSSMFYFRVRTL